MVTGPIEYRRERLVRTKVFLLRHATKLLYAGPPFIVAGFMAAFFGAHVHAANRITLVVALFLWLTLVVSAVLWAGLSAEARALADGGDQPHQ